MLTLKGRGYFTNEKDGWGSIMPPPPWLSGFVVMAEEADFFKVLIFCKQKNIL